MRRCLSTSFSTIKTHDKRGRRIKHKIEVRNEVSLGVEQRGSVMVVMAAWIPFVVMPFDCQDGVGQRSSFGV